MNLPFKQSPASQEELKDLGFGATVAQDSRQRLLNRDGSFNVSRQGLRFWSSLNLYHILLMTSWVKFFLLVVLFYLITNLFFGIVYLLCGPKALVGMVDGTLIERFSQCFFFSVQTFATIGYGQIGPANLAAHLAVTVEALVGLLGFALATGLLFARFSRPSAKIIFSKNALIAPYRGITAFEFRISNARTNQIIELGAKVLFTKLEDLGGKRSRQFYNLNLERDKVVFFPLSWTIVHPIDEQSPLYGLTMKELQDVDAEFLILLTGIDETSSQTVHARSSYKVSEMVWQAKFANIFNQGQERLTIDVGRLDEIEMIEPERDI